MAEVLSRARARKEIDQETNQDAVVACALDYIINETEVYFCCCLVVLL
jgi:hypothetical protein